MHRGEQTLIARVAKYATTIPHHVVAANGDNRLTYEQLDRESTAVASCLRQSGFGRGHVIAIDLGRDVSTLTAMLGIMKAAAAYTVIDLYLGGAIEYDAVIRSVKRTPRPNRPAYREKILDLDEMVERRPDGDPWTEPELDERAYVIYTSGTTGRPKGVPVTHSNIRHYVESIVTRFDLREPLAYAHVSSLAADLGNTCLFLALWTGGTVHLVNEETRRDAVALVRYLTAYQIDFVKITPTHLQALIDEGIQQNKTSLRLRYLFVGGETLTRSLARRIIDAQIASTFVNHYGPTEATIGVSTYLVSEETLSAEPPSGEVPIGNVLGRNQVLLRTADGSVKRRAAEGELYVTGPSVVAGYREDPQATAAAFTAEFDDRKTYYRTGDRVRIDETGCMWFIGRTDRQVKLNGRRLELGAVECLIGSLLGYDAVVFLRKTAFNEHLVAVVAAESISHGALRNVLEAGMPKSQVPVFVSIATFPRTSNGKRNVDAAIQLAEAELGRRSGDEPDSDALTSAVRDAWADALGHRQFNDDESFFDAGGSSLAGIYLVGRLQSSGHSVSVAQFLSDPTLTAVVGFLRHGSIDAVPAPRQPSLTSYLHERAGGRRDAHRSKRNGPYESIVLTGATGFLGAHLLHELLDTTGAHILCIVRERQGVSATAKLNRSFQYYFPGEPLSAYAGRVTVIPGDITQERLGLKAADYAVCSGTDAVFHFAADTRLFGALSEFGAANTFATQAVVDLIRNKKEKDLHYASTLAIAGTNSATKPARVFAESSLDIGQKLVAYEQSKYRAEVAVKQFREAGGRAYIYRYGAISGDSVSGRFQINPEQNRLVQFIRAVTRVRKLPSMVTGGVALTPVDVAVKGTLALSTQLDLKPGTFHVATSHSTPFHVIFEALKDHGFTFAQVDVASFSEMFGIEFREGNSDAALGYHWSQSWDRNVRFDHRLTAALLKRHGLSFEPPSEAWIKLLLAQLIQVGALKKGPVLTSHSQWEN